jgi:hypothetical protein
MRWALPACAALAAASLLWHAAPSYDPWAWIIWGREIARGELSTVEGPSWKPLPVVVTSVLALAGDAAVPPGWLLAARAGALLAVVMTYRLARRVAGRVAGVVCAFGLLLSFGYLRYARHGASEGLLVALVAWAVERHLDGRRDHAFLLAVLAALLRPEVWPFLALYAVVVWRSEPRGRPVVLGSALLVPALWIGPELVGSGDALRASGRARQPLAHSAAFAERPALEVLRSGWAMLVPSLALVALGTTAAALARPRRDALLLVLAGASAAWVALVAAMTEAGYAGNPRYLVPVSAAMAVLAGVGVARLARAAAALVGVGVARLARAAAALAGSGAAPAGRGELAPEAGSRAPRARAAAGPPSGRRAAPAGRGELAPGAGSRAPRARAAAGPPSGRRVAPARLPRAAQAAALALLAAVLMPAAAPRLRELPGHVELARAEVEQVRTLEAAVARVGGAGAVASCGHAYTGLYKVPLVAWTLDRRVGDVDFEPAAPGVVFRTRGNGRVRPDPSVPATRPPFRAVARAGEWDVLAACAPGRGRLVSGDAAG